MRLNIVSLSIPHNLNYLKKFVGVQKSFKKLVKGLICFLATSLFERFLGKTADPFIQDFVTFQHPYQLFLTTEVIWGQGAYT